MLQYALYPQVQAYSIKIPVKQLCSGCLNTDMGFGSGDAQWHSLQGGSSTDSNSKPNTKEHDITRVYFEYLKMQCAVMYSIYKV